jgi:hypothetical protein
MGARPIGVRWIFECDGCGDELEVGNAIDEQDNIDRTVPLMDATAWARTNGWVEGKAHWFCNRCAMMEEG